MQAALPGNQVTLLHYPWFTQIWKQSYGNMGQILLNIKWEEHRLQIETPALPHPDCLSLDNFSNFCEPQCPHLKENLDVSSVTCPTVCFEMIYVRHPVVPDVPSE